MARHRAGAASRRGHTLARPNWLRAGANRVKQARGWESHLGAELSEAWRGLRRAGWSGTRARVSGGGWRCGQSARESGAARNEAGVSMGHWRGLRRELIMWAGVVAEKSGYVRKCALACP
jgi:hypothetical protein